MRNASTETVIGMITSKGDSRTTVIALLLLALDVIVLAPGVPA